MALVSKEADFSSTTARLETELSSVRQHLQSMESEKESVLRDKESLLEEVRFRNETLKDKPKQNKQKCKTKNNKNKKLGSGGGGGYTELLVLHGLFFNKKLLISKLVDSESTLVVLTTVKEKV